MRRLLAVVLPALLAAAIATAAAHGGPSAVPAAKRIHSPLPVLGMAKVEITPDLAAGKVRLSGYAGRWRKPATGVLDPVWARALVGADTRGRLAGVVGLDLCYVSADLRDRVLAKLAGRGFTSANLLLAATHTHSSIAGLDRTPVARLMFGPFDEALLERTATRIAQAVTHAQDAMVPARWEIATAVLTGMSRSRLDPAFSVDESGYAKGMKPDPAKYPIDGRLTVLRVSTVDGKALGAVVHFAAHPTILSPKNLRVSPDYPGVIYARVEAALGAGTVAVFLNGTLGDTAPTPDWADDVATEERQVREYGNRLADEVVRAMPDVRPMKRGEIETGETTRAFPSVTLRALHGWTPPLSFARAFYTRPEMPFQAVRLGDLTLLAVPGEPTTKVGAELMSLCAAGETCRVVAPAGGYMGYLVTPEEYAGGTYAADSSFYGPNVIDRLREAFRAVLAELR
jgi:hypothetical protein